MVINNKSGPFKKALLNSYKLSDFRLYASKSTVGFSTVGRSTSSVRKILVEAPRGDVYANVISVD